MSSPAGTWSETFSVQGRPISSVLHLTPNGRVFLLAGPPHGGAGSGTWAVTGPDTFSYRIAERMIEVATGKFLGWVDIDHHAVLTGDTFVSTGVSRIYDANDNLLHTVDVEAHGTRSTDARATSQFVL